MRVEPSFVAGYMSGYPVKREAIIRFVAVLIAAMCFFVVPATDAEGVHADLPELDTSAKPAEAFVADGVSRFSKTRGFGFHFATDGTHLLCVLYDLQDGTPICISDEQQSLIYDLPHNRIVRAPNSRAYLSLDWKEKEIRPLVFNFGDNYQTNPATLGEKSRTYFQIRHFLEAPKGTLVSLPTRDGSQLWAAQRDGATGKSIEALQFRNDPAGKVTWLRFTSFNLGNNYFNFELEATPGKPPAEALRFPDNGKAQPRPAGPGR